MKSHLINWKKLSSQANLYFPFFHLYDLYLFLLKLITQDKKTDCILYLECHFHHVEMQYILDSRT